MKFRNWLRVVPMLCCLDPAGVAAQTEPDPAGISSVRELLRADTALAVRRMNEQLRTARTQSEVSGATESSGRSAPRLVAIYGVGKKLLAQVDVGDEPMLYMRGKPTPIGRSNDASAFFLKDIDGACVELERHDEAHTLCLHPGSFSRN